MGIDFDLSVFIDAMVSGVPLTFVVIGCTWLAGKWLSGKAQLMAALLIGTAWGIPYMVIQSRPPVGDAWLSFGYWFACVAYGIGLGALAALLYETAKDLGKKLVEKLVEKYLPPSVQ